MVRDHDCGHIRALDPIHAFHPSGPPLRVHPRKDDISGRHVAVSVHRSLDATPPAIRAIRNERTDLRNLGRIGRDKNDERLLGRIHHELEVVLV